MKFNKRVKKYAKDNHYYRLSKVKRYLKLFDRKIEYLKKNMPISNCPECKSTNVFIECSDDEYSSYTFMYCYVCGEEYEDDNYINAISELESYNWFDTIEMMIWGDEENIDFKSYKWQQYCDEEIDKMIKKLSS